MSNFLNFLSTFPVFNFFDNDIYIIANSHVMRKGLIFLFILSFYLGYIRKYRSYSMCIILLRLAFILFFGLFISLFSYLLPQDEYPKVLDKIHSDISLAISLATTIKDKCYLEYPACSKSMFQCLHFSKNFL